MNQVDREFLDFIYPDGVPELDPAKQSCDDCGTMDFDCHWGRGHTGKWLCGLCRWEEDERMYPDG